MSTEISWSRVEKGLATGQQQAWLVWGEVSARMQGPRTATNTAFGVLLGGVDTVLTPVAAWGNPTQSPAPRLSWC